MKFYTNNHNFITCDDIIYGILVSTKDGVYNKERVYSNYSDIQGEVLIRDGRY